MHIDKHPIFSLEQSLGDQGPKDSLGWRASWTPEQTLTHLVVLRLRWWERAWTKQHCSRRFHFAWVVWQTWFPAYRFLRDVNKMKFSQLRRIQNKVEKIPSKRPKSPREAAVADWHLGLWRERRVHRTQLTSPDWPWQPKAQWEGWW